MPYKVSDMCERDPALYLISTVRPIFKAQIPCLPILLWVGHTYITIAYKIKHTI